MSLYTHGVTLLGSNISPFDDGTLEDDVPFPKVRYVIVRGYPSPIPS